MSQSKKLSIIESIAQSTVSFIMTMAVLMLVLDDMDFVYQLKLGLVILVINVGRQYIIRRIFSYWEEHEDRL